MLYACAVRFDVTGNLENFLDFGTNSVGVGTQACHRVSLRMIDMYDMLQEGISLVSATINRTTPEPEPELCRSSHDPVN